MEDNKQVQLTAKSAEVLRILKETGAKMFSDQIAEQNPSMFEKGGKSVNPIMTHLVKAGYVAKEKAVREVIDSKGLKVQKEHTLYFVTDAGAELVFTIKAA